MDTVPKQPSGSYTCEAHRLLAELPGSLRDLSERAGVARATIATWRSGQKRPGREARVQLEAQLGIPAAAWDTPSGLNPSSPPAAKAQQAPTQPDPTAEDVRSAVAHGASRAELERLLARARELQQGRQLLEADYARYIDLELKILQAISKIDDAAPVSESKLAGSPAFRRLTAIAMESLEPYPEAARAFLTKLGAELGTGHG